MISFKGIRGAIERGIAQKDEHTNLLSISIKVIIHS